jgi:hypothetical protein
VKFLAGSPGKTVLDAPTEKRRSMRRFSFGRPQGGVAPDFLQRCHVAFGYPQWTPVRAGR